MGICLGQAPEENSRLASQNPTTTTEPHPSRRQQIVSPKNCVRNAFNIFESQGVIGRGSTCLVVRANIASHCDMDNYSFMHRGDMEIGCPIALKVIPRSNAGAVRSFRREVTVLQQLQHTNIIQLHGIFMDTNRLFIVQQLCLGGTLYDYIRGRVCSEDVCRNIMRQLLTSVAYLQSNRIVHRDIKPENIMFVDKNRRKIVLADFGQAIQLDSTTDVRTRAGTPVFFAPELCSARSRPAMTSRELFACDMWSAGVTCFQMLTGQYPFIGNTRRQLFDQIRTREVPTARLKLLSRHARSFVLGLLDKDWASRLDVESALRHPWLDECSRIKKLRVADDSVSSRSTKCCPQEFDDLCLSVRKVDPTMYDEARLGV